MIKVFNIIALLIMAQICRAQSFSFNKGGTNETNYFSVIPYENVQDKIIVTAEINGKKRRFIFDTGAPNVISKSLLEELNPAMMSKQVTEDANGKKDSIIVVSLKEINLGGIVFKDIPTAYLSTLNFLECFQADGLIGSNMLRNSIVRFSSADKTITLTVQNNKLHLNERQASKMELDKEESIPLIKIEVGGKKHLGQKLMFDSGDGEFYTISMDQFQILKKKELINVIGQGYGSNTLGAFGVEDDTIMYKVAVPEIHVNGLIVKNAISLTTVDQHSRIGEKLLDYGIVTLDYKNKKFYFEPFKDTINIEEKQWGLNPTFKNGKMQVGIVWDDKLRDEIKINDQILAIDDNSYENITLCDLLTLKSPSKFKDKDQITLTLKDKSGTIKKITIKKY